MSTPTPGPPGIRSDASLSEQYEAVRSGAAVHVVERDFVSVTGAEAEAYLQGQCSQDVAGLPPGTAADALLLNPQGKIEAVIRVSRTDTRAESRTGGDAFVIDTDPGSGPAVVTRLERFRLRTKVDIVPLEGWVGVAVRGPGARTVVVGSPALVLAVDWPGHAGLDLLGPAPAALSEWVDVGRAVPCGYDAWEAVRIEAGIPVAGRDEVEGAIPAETGLVDRTVSFTKGCYTGQELVARLDARGSKVARRLCGVVIVPAAGDAGVGGGATSPQARFPAGTVVLTPDGQHEVGRLTSVAWSPGLGADVALAMVHRRVEVPGPVLLRSVGTSGPEERPAEVRPLPLRT